MKVFVTGAAGWVGSRVARLFVSQGHDVLGLVRSTMDHEERVRRGAFGFVCLEGDLADPASWMPQVQAFRPAVCVHCAWYANPQDYLHSRQNIACIEQGLALLDVLSSAGCARAVYVGSCAEYDPNVGYCQEGSPIRPATLYGAAKYTLSVAARNLSSQLTIELVWARLFHLYGPGENPRRVLPSLILALLADGTFEATDGRQIRDYLYIDDVARALIALALRGSTSDYNVSSGVPVTVRSLMEQAGAMVNRADRIHFGAIARQPWDAAYVCGDSSKLCADTGWAPEQGLEAGIRQTVEWWRERWRDQRMKNV